jgi:choice-of-anchor B domain-containing protein
MFPLLASLSAFLPLSVSPDGGEPMAPFPAPRVSGEVGVTFPQHNVQLLAWVPLGLIPGAGNAASDCWGYTSPSGREYAILGTRNGTAFFEVTDPGNPVLLLFSNGEQSAWRTIKTYQSYAYSCNEGGGGIQVFDLSQIDSGLVTRLTSVNLPCSATAHTLALDEVSGFLYRLGGGSGCPGGTKGLAAYDLSNPAVPALVGSWNDAYVHEAQVVTWDVPGPHLGKQIAFCFTESTPGGGSPRLRILDVTNKAAMTVLGTLSYTGGTFCHQGWLTADKSYMYVNDELDDATYGPSRTRIVGLGNLANPQYLGFFSSGAGSTDHNLYVKGNRIYEANYRSGLRVFDNTNPLAPFQVAYFDTVPEDDGLDTSSLWGNYPFFDSGTILGSDQQKGLFVWRLGAHQLHIVIPGGVPDQFPAVGGSFQFRVIELAPGDLEFGSVEVQVSSDGGPFTSVSATPLGGDLYEVEMPAGRCGAMLDYYVSARSPDGVTWTHPFAAPTQVHHALAADSTTDIVTDPMELNTGWSVNLAADLAGHAQATLGTWTLVNPNGSEAQPEDDHSQPGTFCWVTGQAPVGAPPADADVDNGMTTLRSPVLDASGLNNPFLSYWRWLSNDVGGNPGEVPLVVSLSNDGGATWVDVETVGPSGAEASGGWIKHSLCIGDFMTPNANMVLRFRIEDVVGAVVEAAVDDLVIYDVNCPPPPIAIEAITPASGPSEGGNLVTVIGSGFEPWVTSVSIGSNVCQEVHVINYTTLLARVPRGLGPVSGKVASGRVDVSVTNLSTATLPRAYKYEPQR